MKRVPLRIDCEGEAYKYFGCRTDGMNRYLAIMFAVAIASAGCGSQSKVNEVGTKAKSSIQAVLDRDFATDGAKVQRVDVVMLSDSNYEGKVTIAAHDTTFVIPIAITSDRDTTVVTIDKPKIGAALQVSLQHRLALQHRVSELEGKYSDYVLTPSLFELLPSDLQAVRADLEERLQVHVPITLEKDFYFGSGCKAHECGSEAAAWTIRKSTGATSAIILKQAPTEQNGPPLRSVFQLYGTTVDDIPPPLAMWASQNGMNSMKAADDPPKDQPSKADDGIDLNDSAALDKKYGLAASYACATEADDYLRTVATYEFKWDSIGFFDAKFDHYRSIVSAPGVLTVTTDKVALQNQFGAYKHITLNCSYDTQAEKVLHYGIPDQPP
jgi:hypothetical protein